MMFTDQIKIHLEVSRPTVNVTGVSITTKVTIKSKVSELVK